MENIVINLSDLNKYYDTFHALKNVSLKVQKGQILGYLGPNGSGKTTTIKLLLGLMKPSSGHVKLIEEDPYLDDSNSLNLRNKIGAMLDWDGLSLNLTGYENVMYWAELHDIKPEIASPLAYDVIKKVGLFEWKDKRVYEYSFGMKKRLSLARALVNDPDILILDEPTSGIDLESRVLFRKIIKELANNGKTIFFSSHDLEEVQKISTTLAILNKGKIIFTGSLKSFQKEYGQTEIFVEVKTQEYAKLLAQKIAKSASNIEISETTISFITKNHHEIDLDDPNILSSWTRETNLEYTYMNAINSAEGHL